MSDMNSREALHALVDELDDNQISGAHFLLTLLKHDGYQHTNTKTRGEKHHLPTPPPIQYQDAFGARTEAPDND